jgi:hypothetical protein
MREALAPIPCPIAAPALASRMGRTAPRAVASEGGSDCMACDTFARLDERWF